MLSRTAKSLATVILSKLLTFKDSFSGVMNVSGQICRLSASYRMGNISGVLSLATSNKKLSFEFPPRIALRKKNLLYVELKRLFLEYKRSEKGFFKIVADALREDELTENDFNLLDT